MTGRSILRCLLSQWNPTWQKLFLVGKNRFVGKQIRVMMKDISHFVAQPFLFHALNLFLLLSHRFLAPYFFFFFSPPSHLALFLFPVTGTNRGDRTNYRGCCWLSYCVFARNSKRPPELSSPQRFLKPAFDREFQQLGFLGF